MLISKSAISTLAIAVLLATLIPLEQAGATQQIWTDFSAMDSIFGQTVNKYSCWTLGDTNSLPVLQLKVSGQWTTVASGQILGANDKVTFPCGSNSNVIIGYTWILNQPNPDNNSLPVSFLYYQERMPDITTYTIQQVPESVEVDVKKVELISITTKKLVSQTKLVNGKRTIVKKYVSVSKKIPQTITFPTYQTQLVNKSVPQVVPGYTSPVGTLKAWDSMLIYQQALQDPTNIKYCAFLQDCPANP